MSYPPGMKHGRGELEVDVDCPECEETTRLRVYEEAWGSEWKDDPKCSACGADLSDAEGEEPDYETEMADRMEDYER